MKGILEKAKMMLPWLILGILFLISMVILLSKFEPLFESVPRLNDLTEAVETMWGFVNK